MKITRAPSGAVHRLTVESAALRGNAQASPTARAVDVYVPAGETGAGLALLVDLVGFTAGGPAHTNWVAFRENVPERLDRLIGEGRMAPVVVTFPDCWTRLGGNQYVNSLGTGRWSDFVADEVVAAVEARFGCGGAGRRGVFGKSSGGYGALVQAMTRPDVWAAAACHSGDMAFELCYGPDFFDALRALAKAGGARAWLEAFWAKPKPGEKDFKVLNVLAMAAHYDPDPDDPVWPRLPLDPHTADLIPERWAAWLAHDPLRMVETHAEALKGLKALFVDCGAADQFNLVYGARRFIRRLQALGVPHRYEEFDDDHSAIDYRMDVSLPLLAAALA